MAYLFGSACSYNHADIIPLVLLVSSVRTIAKAFAQLDKINGSAKQIDAKKAN